MRILITGSGRGIGKCLRHHYLEQGADVHGINSKDCNLADWDQTFEYFSRNAVEDIELVIHCAASNVTSFFYKQTCESFREMVDTNIIGTFNLLKCAIPRLKKHGGIILFTSAAAFSPRIGQAAYACCKSALNGLVKVLVQEMLAEEKYIYLIAPGMVETGMPEKMLSEAAIEKARGIIPMNRFCKMEELINAIDFLHGTPYMTGQTLHLNGSYHVP